MKFTETIIASAAAVLSMGYCKLLQQDETNWLDQPACMVYSLEFEEQQKLDETGGLEGLGTLYMLKDGHDQLKVSNLNWARSFKCTNLVWDNWASCMNGGSCFTGETFLEPNSGSHAGSISQYTEGVDWDIVTLKLVRPTPERVQKYKDGAYDYDYSKDE